MPAERVDIREQPSGSGEICRRILDTLPTWFGVPEANADYVAKAESDPVLIASHGDRDVGLLQLIRHFPHSAEIHLVAVVADRHRHGVGRALLAHAERELAEAGVEFLQVKTLSSRREDPGYAKTREFYLAQGFQPLEEFPNLWGPENPALQMIKSVR